MQITNTLKKIVEDPKTHACWLNSLAYLEYRGFRKIVRSRTTEEMSLEMLLHTAEEVRHSLFFKRLAVKIGGNEFKYFEVKSLLCFQDLKNYFYEIDSRTTSALIGIGSGIISMAAYSLVTWLVETRAISFYEKYDQVLKAASAEFSLSNILKEENIHLKEIGTKADRLLREKGFDIDLIFDIEQREFNKLWNSIEIEVSQRAFNEAQV